MIFRIALLLLFTMITSAAFTECGDNLDPSLSGDEGTYTLELSPEAYVIVYFYNGDYRVMPKADLSKYWKPAEMPKSWGEIKIKKRETTPENAEIEKLTVTVPTASGNTQDVELDLDVVKRRGTALINWTESQISDKCTFGIGDGIEITYNDEHGDEFTLTRETAWSYYSTGYPPTNCSGPLAEIRDDLKQYTDPFMIPDPMWRLFIASKLLPYDLMEKTIVMKVKLIETGSRVTY